MSVSVRKLGSYWIVLKSESNLSILRMLLMSLDYVASRFISASASHDFDQALGK